MILNIMQTKLDKIKIYDNIYVVIFISVCLYRNIYMQAKKGFVCIQNSFLVYQKRCKRKEMKDDKGRNI